MTMHRPFTHSRGRQNVLLDLASTDLSAADSRSIDDALSALIRQPHLQLVGVCCSVGPADDAALVHQRVDQVIGVMEQVRRDHGLILTELVVEEDQDLATTPMGGLPDQDALLAAIDDALDDACARNRYPRPAIILMACPTVTGAPKPELNVNSSPVS
ncbi:decarboxylase [Rhodococcus opacus]|uniref:decarboxylase n=1 Tax=Rhodococcus opacus TaxID=37919 RepID=UPI002235F62E|nr:decarboxylase [Rhodococcus opacus]UZG55264.1 decarboxylase [Rhodococcus opacus]